MIVTTMPPAVGKPVIGREGGESRAIPTLAHEIKKTIKKRTHNNDIYEK
jgi:hypothetical protein